MKLLKNDFQNVTRDLCLVFFLICGFSTFSQDTLLLTSSEKIPVIIRFYNGSKVVYSNLSEPSSTIKIESKEVVKIIFKNGKTFNYNNQFAPINQKISQNNSIDQNTNTTIKTIQPNADEKIVSDGKDKVLLKNGEEISAKVLTVSEKEISYKKADFLDGPTYTILPSSVFMITYSNGIKDIFNQQTEIKNTINNTSITEGELASKARRDAEQNFSGVGPFFAGFSSILLSPIFALIPAAIVSSNEPNESKLNYPNQELYDKNIQYQNSYRKEAYKIKKKNVWAGYGVGAFINIALALIIIYR